MSWISRKASKTLSAEHRRFCLSCKRAFRETFLTWCPKTICGEGRLHKCWDMKQIVFYSKIWNFVVQHNFFGLHSGGTSNVENFGHWRYVPLPRPWWIVATAVDNEALTTAHHPFEGSNPSWNWRLGVSPKLGPCKKEGKKRTLKFWMKLNMTRDDEWGTEEFVDFFAKYQYWLGLFLLRCDPKSLQNSPVFRRMAPQRCHTLWLEYLRQEVFHFYVCFRFHIHFILILYFRCISLWLYISYRFYISYSFHLHFIWLPLISSISSLPVFSVEGWPTWWSIRWPVTKVLRRRDRGNPKFLGTSSDDVLKAYDTYCKVHMIINRCNITSYFNIICY